MKPIIYITEDDASLQELYMYSLENEFDCCCFDEGGAMFDALLRKRKPDLILLDVMLPGEDGFAILSRLKKDRTVSHIPVIMASAKDDDVSKIRGLNAGADDYIAKPFSVLELEARIKANLRKSGKELSGSIVYKDIVIDLSQHSAAVNGNIMQLTLKEYNLLSLLCRNCQKVQVREVIFSKVWDDNYIGESRTLDIHVKELRRKLAEAGSEAVIKTIRGVGYMLV